MQFLWQARPSGQAHDFKQPRQVHLRRMCTKVYRIQSQWLIQQN